MIKQVIMNLAVNENDVMPDGGKLTIKTENVNIANVHDQSNFHITTNNIEIFKKDREKNDLVLLDLIMPSISG